MMRPFLRELLRGSKTAKPDTVDSEKVNATPPGFLRRWSIVRDYP
jgi:hypothetical protein